MSTLGYVIFAAVLASGIAAIFTRSTKIRRGVVWCYLVLIALIALAIFLVGPRSAHSQVLASGRTWTAEMAIGASAMHHTSMVLGGMLLLIATVLAILALSRR